jgi:alcohol dehydrogenase
MKAVVIHKAKKVEVEEVPDPTILKPNDMIIKVTSTAICGTDLHFYNGLFPIEKPIHLGHEFMGIVEEVGKNITHVKKGDRVLVPCIIGCGQCYFCAHGLPPHCQNTNHHYGPEGNDKEKGGGVFGLGEGNGNYDGGQAEYVRVPWAKFGVIKVDDQLKDEEVLFLTDIFPTGWAAVERCELKGGETVAVFGCGPVGIMAQKAAWLQGAGRVIGIDVLDYRLDLAKQTAKSETIHAKKVNAVEKIREMTEGRGADVCIDAVGLEAQQSFWEKMINAFGQQAGSINALQSAMSGVRRGGIVSAIGVYGGNYSNFSLGQLFDKALTLKSGPVPLPSGLSELTNLVRERKVVLDDIITHTLPLSDAKKGYKIFNDKQDRCLKVVLKP